MQRSTVRCYSNTGTQYLNTLKLKANIQEKKSMNPLLGGYRLKEVEVPSLQARQTASGTDVMLKSTRVVLTAGQHILFVIVY